MAMPFRDSLHLELTDEAQETRQAARRMSLPHAGQVYLMNCRTMKSTGLIETEASITTTLNRLSMRFFITALLVPSRNEKLQTQYFQD
jgi:hypothetical protein